ncbi:MAG: ATPase, T2SS/T4P/T4SS family [Lentisphaeria bacterium]
MPNPRLNYENPKVISIEDPVEFALPNVVQTAVNTDAGLTFSRALRAAVWAAADVVMVDHLPDSETLQQILQMAATGQRILTMLNAGSASEALRRLVDMGRVLPDSSGHHLQMTSPDEISCRNRFFPSHKWKLGQPMNFQTGCSFISAVSTVSDTMT